MKWGIVLLLLLGVVAAACAAVLVNTLKADTAGPVGEDSSAGIEVAKAKKPLPAMTVITLEHLVKETAPRHELPEGQVSRPAQVVGRVLSVPVVEGQILTDSCFVTEGTGAILAAALPHGMRAVSVNLSSRSIPDKLLLYPGCVVDVLVSFRLTSAERSKGQAISTTLLRGIQVLAVQGDSVVSQDVEETAGKLKQHTTTRGLVTVTLMVDPKQAEALQLAADNGTISLAIRNPLDKTQADIEGTVLSQGRLANLGSILTSAVLATGRKEQASPAEQPLTTENSTETKQAQEGTPPDTDVVVQEPEPEEEYQKPASPHWDVTVIRGRETKLEELAVKESEAIAEAGLKR
jgi:pilus assembly protein CpaB